MLERCTYWKIIVAVCGDAVRLLRYASMRHALQALSSCCRRGRLPAGFWDWAMGANFSFVKDDDVFNSKENGNAAVPGTDSALGSVDSAEACSGDSNGEATPSGADLSSPFQLRSADCLATPFTNYVRGYAGLLDYIWYQPARMRVPRGLSPAARS